MNCFGNLSSAQTRQSVPYYCIVELLDGSEVKFHVPEEANGAVLLQKVWEHLNLFEKDYFSLRFLNTSNKTSFWIDGQKNIQKQLRRHGIKEKHPKFYFGVKFYAVDPCRLTEEITRYQFFQQSRRDVAAGRLSLTFSSLAELGALVAQSEFGDYDPGMHATGYLKSLKLTTDSFSDDLQTAITEIHRDKLRGVLPYQCELMYLDLIRKQDVYGVEFYGAKGAENAEYKVGASPHGIVIYRGKHRVGLYHWPRIDIINFKAKELILQVRDKHSSGTTNHAFTCTSTRVCKQLWKSCIEHHSFFRLSENKHQQETARLRLLQLGSKYRYSGRTEREMASVESRKNQPAVNRPLSGKLTTERHQRNDIEEPNQDQNMTSWIGEAKDASPMNGMFTSTNGSPGSVRSLKLKFQPKGTDIDGDLKKQSFRTRPTRTNSYTEGDRDSTKSTRSERYARRIHQERVPSQSSKPLGYEEQRDNQSSVNRIVRSYIPNGGTSFFNSNDIRRHSERNMSTKPREYENIVYNDQGLPVILATHRGERADEKMPFYQQSWLQQSKLTVSNSHNKEPTLASRLSKSSVAERASFSGTSSRAEKTPNPITDPLMYSILNTTPTSSQPRKSNLGFYEEKLMNRDSGTDSPTCNNYEDPNNIFKLIQTLGSERKQLTKGDQLSCHETEWDTLGSQHYTPSNYYSSTQQSRVGLDGGTLPHTAKIMQNTGAITPNTGKTHNSASMKPNTSKTQSTARVTPNTVRTPSHMVGMHAAKTSGLKHTTPVRVTII